MLLELHRPANKKSKANLCFDALEKYYTCKNNFSEKIQNTQAISVFWGLGGSNFQKVKYCQSNCIPWLFIDMPYHGRWDPTDVDWSLCYAKWRMIPNNLHRVGNDHTEKAQTDLPKKILLCPSSSIVTQFLIGKTAEQWVADTVKYCKNLRPDTEISVRYKPRSNTYSGPAAADISIKDQILQNSMVVTLASISAVDAVQEKIPSVFTHIGCSPVDVTARQLGKNHSVLNTSEYNQLFNTLNDYQFTLGEIKFGKATKVIEQCYLHT